MGSFEGIREDGLRSVAYEIRVHGVSRVDEHDC